MSLSCDNSPVALHKFGLLLAENALVLLGYSPPLSCTDWLANSVTCSCERCPDTSIETSLAFN